MSRKDPTGHIDANVTDYQKMVQGRGSSTGWSSTHHGYSPFANRPSSVHGDSYLNSRQNLSYGHHGNRDFKHKPLTGYLGTYQPSKYGMTSDTSYTSTVEPNYRTLEQDNSSSTFRSENGYDRNYGYVSREFDLAPYRSNRTTGYTSDSGHVPLTKRTTDYSSDSGLSFDRHRKKQPEYDLEVPSPDSSHSRSVQHNFSPVKSQKPVPDYMLTPSDNQRYFTALKNGAVQESMADFQITSRREPTTKEKLEEYHNNFRDDIKSNGHSFPNSGLNGKGLDLDRKPFNPDLDPHSHSHSEEDDSFTSPTLYKGEIGGNLTLLAHRQQRTSPTEPPANVSPRYPTSQLTSTSQESFNHKPHRHSPPPHHYLDNHHNDNHAISNMPTEPRPSEKIEQIRSVADAVIRDKDAIIDELRGKIVDLEMKEYESRMRFTAMTRRDGHMNEESATFSKMQELEYKNAELRREMANLRLQKDREVEDLEIKLGGVEHEIDQLRTALRKAQPNALEMKEKLKEKEEECEDVKGKLSQMSGQYRDLKKKLGEMENYLADCPTIEEFTSKEEQCGSLKKENQLLKEQVEDLEYRLNETSQLVSERETTIMELEGKMKHLGSKLNDVSMEIERIKSDGEGKELRLCQEKLFETEEHRDRIARDLDKAKKLLEVSHRRLRQLEVKHQSEVRQLQERVTQEEESGVALRRELSMKEEQNAKLKKAAKEYASKSQDLMDETLILKEQLKQIEQMSTDENKKLQHRFFKEMSLCFSELQSVVQICVQRAEGKEPDMSLLLGTKGASYDENEEEGATGGRQREEKTLKHWFTKLKELRGEVEKVRSMICIKFAEEMGDNLNCATQ